MPKEPDSVLLVGLPATGKTTFLAALWHVLSADEVQSELALEDCLEEDRRYISSRHQEWLGYKPVQRTRLQAREEINLSLRDRATSERLRLAVPDLSGEVFQGQLHDRRMSIDFHNAVAGATGVLLFVHPEKLKVPPLIAEAEAAISVLQSLEGEVGRGAPCPHGEADEDSVQRQPEDWNPARCCDLAQITEILQFLCRSRSGSRLRVAVILSAMDLLDGTGFEEKPSKFVRDRGGLFDQYLRARSVDLLEYKIFGVSAQGAAYDPEGLRVLQGKDQASDRIRVVQDESSLGTNVCAPLRWVLLANSAGQPTPG